MLFYLIFTIILRNRYGRLNFTDEEQLKMGGGGGGGLVTQSCPATATPWTVATRLLCPWDSLGKNTGVGCHFLLQGIFPTQGSNLGLLHCMQILYQVSYKGSPTLGGPTLQSRPPFHDLTPNHSIYYLLILILEKAMAPHSSTLAWKIPWTEEPGRLQSMGSQRVRHD